MRNKRSNITYLPRSSSISQPARKSGKVSAANSQVLAYGGPRQHLGASVEGLGLCVWDSELEVSPARVGEVVDRPGVFEHRVKEYEGGVPDALGYEEESAYLRDRGFS